MLGVIATIPVAEGREAAFEEAFTAMAAQVKAHEPGNHMYQLMRPRDGSRDYKVVELYADDAALEAHRGSDHFKAGGRALRDFVAGPLKVELFDPVG